MLIRPRNAWRVGAAHIILCVLGSCASNPSDSQTPYAVVLDLSEAQATDYLKTTVSTTTLAGTITASDTTRELLRFSYTRSYDGSSALPKLTIHLNDSTIIDDNGVIYDYWSLHGTFEYFEANWLYTGRADAALLSSVYTPDHFLDSIVVMPLGFESGLPWLLTDDPQFGSIAKVYAGRTPAPTASCTDSTRMFEIQFDRNRDGAVDSAETAREFYCANKLVSRYHVRRVFQSLPDGDSLITQVTTDSISFDAI